MFKKMSLMVFMVFMCLFCFLSTHNDNANAHPKKIIQYANFTMDACSIHDYPVVSTQTAIWGYSYVAEPHTECGHKQTVELVHQIFLNWIQCNAAENEPCEHSEE